VVDSRSILILSDIHYAGAAERERGWRESQFVSSPLLQLGLRAYRHFVWRRDPFAHNYLLDRFLQEAPTADFVVGNGDYSCDSAFVGLSDEPSFQSADECLQKLRKEFGQKLHLTIGDHELGKTSLFGGQGGMRLASWRRVREELKLPGFWQVEAGCYIVMGVTSSLLALPVYRPETLPEERAAWEDLRDVQCEAIRKAFESLHPSQRVILFCHDPTALPFLWRDDCVRSRIEQIDATVIGHLHSEFYMLNSRLLSGMPTLHIFGTAIRRMSAALNEARHWKPFKVRLCPSLAGIQLLKDGGYLRLELDPNGRRPPEFRLHRLRWNDTVG
jgi:predicted MPP superfamily phosphohydrolase